MINQSKNLPKIHGYQQTGNMLFGYIINAAGKYFQRERREKRDIASLEQWEKRRNNCLASFKTMLGPFPEKTPLNPIVTGVIKRDGYRIEKIIFESRMRFYVTANLYLPSDESRPVPGILLPCGHSREGKAYPAYQHVCRSLVKQGHAVLTYDPLGQGERIQFFDPKNPDLDFWGSKEHNYEGYQCYLTGTNVAQYMIWDSIRAIDYLCARPEIDKDRIGCMGTSGGGLNTAYLCALEERIKAAMPCCYITEREVFLQSGNPADSEQNLSGAIRHGINYDDFVALFAPRPLRIGACVWDYFPIEGARIAYKRAKRIYSLYQAIKNISLVEIVSAHGLCKEMRESACDWFNLHLKGKQTKFKETELRQEEVATLQCTKTGQINGDFPGANTVFSFNSKLAGKIAHSAEKQSPAIEKNLKNIFRFEERQVRPADARCLHGEIKEGNFLFEKWFFYSEKEIVVPLVVIRPETGRVHSACLLVGEEDKEMVVNNQWDEVEALLKEKHLVCAMECRGIGETRSRPLNNYRYDDPNGGTLDKLYQDCIMLETPLITMQVFDVVQTILFLKKQFKPQSIHLCGYGKGAVIALFAACFVEKLASLALKDMPVSFRNIAESKEYRPDYASLVIPGILGCFDIPDIIAYLHPLKITIKEMTKTV